MSDVFTLTLACADCLERRQDLEATGHHVLDCREDPAVPGYCTLRYTRPEAAAAQAAPPLPASQAQAAKAIVNVFETGSVRGDYGAAQVIGREDLLTDPRFETKMSRHKHAPELIAILDQVFATKPLAHWRKALDGNGLIFGVVGIPADIPDDEQMRVTEAVVPFADSDLRTINTPIFIEGAKKVQPRMAPNVGQHSDEVLTAAGFSAAEIAKMRAAGIVA